MGPTMINETLVFLKMPTNCRSFSNPFAKPLISDCEKLKILTNYFPSCFMQPKMNQWEIPFVKFHLIYHYVSNPVINHL